MARPIGSREIPLRDIRFIVEKTKEGWERPRIAEEIGVASRTVYRYQSEFDLI